VHGTSPDSNKMNPVFSHSCTCYFRFCEGKTEINDFKAGLKEKAALL
jgi:hypothetical protein